MKPQIIKSKDKNRILDRVRELAESYTPDWNPDFNDPDFGSALALIFKDMYLEQAERLNRMPHKQRRDIVNLFEPAPVGPVASRGYVSFELSEGASSGVFLEEGFELLAQGKDETEIHFETVEPVYVTHSRMEKAIVYDHETGWFSIKKTDPTGLNFPLFHVQGSENENQPDFEIFDTKWLHIRAGMEIGFDFTTDHELDQSRLLEGLSDKEKAIWFIEVNDERVILDVKIKQECLWIGMSGKLRLTEQVKCELLDIPYFRDMVIVDLKLNLIAKSLEPENLLYNENILESSNIKPFGEKFNVFDIFLLGDQSLLSKEGAEIHINMKMKEQLIPIVNDSEEPLVKWRNVMHESELREPEAKTIRIENLQWEYWNGIGWTPLPVNKEAFNIPSEGQWHISFTCPSDLTAAIFGPTESHYIRARVTKVQNAFSPKGNTAVPIIKELHMSADTKVQKNFTDVRPETFKVQANLETNHLSKLDIPKRPFLLAQTPDKDVNKAVYLSLTSALDKGPIRIEVEPELMQSDLGPAEYKIQYYGTRNGRESWHDLPHEDETDGFIMNGLMSFMAPKRMSKLTRFGTESFWIRLVPMISFNSVVNQQVYNRSLNIRINSVQIRQKETLTSEYYAVPAIQPWASIFLSRSPVLEADVWVNELGIMSDEELSKTLEEKPEVISLENDKRGELIGIWRKWNHVLNFSENLHHGRIFVLDLEHGIITFGDGKIGRIPHSDLSEYIRVDYALGGGTIGNVPAGMVTKAVTSIPFLERVYNGGPIWGGLGTESTKHAEKRVSEHIRHRGMALSHRDIEAIITAENRDIHDVKVTSSKGELKVSVLPDQFPYQISHFYEIREKTEAILNESISLMVSSQQRISIEEPIKLAFSVNMDVMVESAGDYIKALSRWNDQLEKYFNPLRGGPKNKGWKIGALPEHTSILSDLKHMLVGSEQIGSVMIQMHIIDGSKRIPVRNGGRVDLSHAIPVNGQHDVRIRISNLK